MRVKWFTVISLLHYQKLAKVTVHLFPLAFLRGMLKIQGLIHAGRLITMNEVFLRKLKCYLKIHHPQSPSHPIQK